MSEIRKSEIDRARVLRSARTGGRAPGMAAQRGVTLITWVFIIAIAILIGTAGLRLIPVYLEHYKILSAMRSVSAEFAGQGAASGPMRLAIGKRFDIESVSVIKRSDVKFERKGEATVIRVQYEHRAPFIANVNFLVEFDTAVEVPR